MRVTPVVAAVSFLLLLLTWLSFRAINTDAERFDRALAALDRFTLAESALQRDVLSARIGVLRNYDPLVHSINDLDLSLLQLRETMAVDPDVALVLNRLAESVTSQEDLVEQFKSNNALLQNSLAYFGVYSTRLGASARAGPVVPAISGLAAAMLHLTLDTSPETAREVASWLDELATQPPPPDQAALVHALLAHGRMLHALLPATDGVLAALRTLPQRRDREALRTMVLERQQASRTVARKFRLILYVTSLLLVAVLVYLGLQLRARALALQRRAAFEHMIACISTDFIDTRPNALGTQIELALAELAERVGADRAYFVPGGTAAERYVWSRDGLTLPAMWPDAAVELAARLRPAGDGVIHIPCAACLPPGPDRDTLVSAGLTGWVCIADSLEAASRGILGFDVVRPRHRSQTGELGLLRMAHDAVANAVRRAALEQEAARLEQRLQQSRRMETVGALASGIAHNFNNTIAAILGYAEIAESHVSADSPPARDIAEIRRAGEHARDLVDQILAFGRRRDTRRKPVCVRDLIAEAESLLTVSLPSSIELSVRDLTGSTILSGERGQLLQVILNLGNNAAQAMDGCGPIKLEADSHDLNRTQPLSHGDLPPGRYVRIAVSDSGRGMDEAVLSRIFEPFFTTRLAGNGLGLATVHEIVREHGGVMNVCSEPYAGSRFEAWLPCSPDDSPAPQDAPSSLPLGFGETVLVIDAKREQLLRDEEILAALGYEPIGFACAADAVTACRNEPGRFDVLLVAHHAAVTSTLGLARELHGIAPALPILLAAASANEIGSDALLAAGIADVVHWPIIATEIAAALENVLATTRPQAGIAKSIDRPSTDPR